MNGDCQTLPLYQGSGWPFVLLSTAAPPQAPGLPIYRRYRTLLGRIRADGTLDDLRRLAGAGAAESLEDVFFRLTDPPTGATVARGARTAP